VSRLVSGLQPVREAIRARGSELEKVLVAHGAGDDAQLDAVARFAKDHGVTVERVARVELDRLARGARHQGPSRSRPTFSSRRSTTSLRTRRRSSSRSTSCKIRRTSARS
jgi:predicted alpha/beta-hydrolase family hydrolase